MRVIKHDQIVMFDVDDTLVMWQKSVVAPPHANAIKFKHNGAVFYLEPHTQHIEDLKAHCVNGKLVIVWSRGGWDWANCVVKTLGLKDFVSIVMTKPHWYYDDIDANEFMERVYREHKKS